ncbi:MAG: pyruvate kinase [Parcubacteria group bacterium]|jgi:pyruvate kinase
MQKKTKIVATIGPASEKIEILREMIKNGMNVARLNFSHGDYSSHKKIIENIRNLSRELGENVGIIADLQGPRIRTIVDENFEIKPGEKVLVYSVSRDAQIPNLNDKDLKIFGLDYPEIIKDIEVGNEILIEDGLLSVKVIEKNSDFLKAEVVNGGVIKNEKGVNIPDAKLKIPPITEKDGKDLEFSLKNEVDFIAMSFVSNAKDIEDLRNKIKRILNRDNNLPQIVAKIERKEAIENLDEIISATDAVMVARGDLGIEMKETKVAILQKEIIAKSINNLKPVIVATEMLNSMIQNPRPTRAEVSDVTNAVIDHADAVMLSGESANGKYPVETVKTMAEIIENTEESPYDDIGNFNINQELSNEYVNFIKNSCSLLLNSNAKAVAILSRGGFTARVISHFRPVQLILVGTNNEKTCYQSSLVWGIKAFLFKNGKIEEVVEHLLKKAQDDKLLGIGDKVVLIGKNDDRNHRFVNIREIQ